ncbi:MAG: radical SAM protein [Fibrobacteria bacterium]|nr:radical SAM protein [Fibrobacteria bacterium]
MVKILLVLPDAHIHRLKIGRFKISFREAPLTLTTLAALVPPELNMDVKIIDESIEDIPFNESFDLVGISCLTGTANRAYAIADQFSNLGSTVVLGGVHLSLIPEEAREHAHSVVIGFAEELWPQLLRDFVHGVLKKEYKSDRVCLENLPVPRRDLQKKFGYMMPNTVFATRGCRGACDFCTVPSVPFGWHMRPVDNVIDEIAALNGKRFTFNDVNLLDNREYAISLFKKMKPLKKKWGGLVSTRIGQDEEMLDLMSESGCIYLLIGFESVLRTATTQINKGFNDPNKYAALMQMMHARNIIVQGCFIFGCDDDGPGIFERTVNMVNELKIDIPRYAIYTPYPKTAAFRKLMSQDRLLHFNWDHYDTQHVVFRPAQMTPEELDKGFRWAYKKTFGLSSITKRLSFKRSFPVLLAGNLAYRMYCNRLDNDTSRLFTGQNVK